MSRKPILCNVCRQQIFISASILKRRLSDGVMFEYFECPYCQAAFLISASDEQFRKLLAKRSRLSKAKKAFLTDREEIRQMSQEQKRMYTPRFKELFPKAYIEEGDDEG